MGLDQLRLVQPPFEANRQVCGPSLVWAPAYFLVNFLLCCKASQGFADNKP